MNGRDFPNWKVIAVRLSSPLTASTLGLVSCKLSHLPGWMGLGGAVESFLFGDFFFTPAYLEWPGDRDGLYRDLWGPHPAHCRQSETENIVKFGSNSLFSYYLNHLPLLSVAFHCLGHSGYKMLLLPLQTFFRGKFSTKKSGSANSELEKEKNWTEHYFRLM